MADPYDRRRRRRKDRLADSIPSQTQRRCDENQPVSVSKPPVKILGLAKPNRGPISVEASSRPVAVSGSHESNESQPQNFGEGSSVGADKGPVVVLTNTGDSHAHSQVSNSKVHSYESETSAGVRRSSQTEASHSVHSGEIHGSQSKRSTIPSSIISGTTEQSSQLHSKLEAPLEKQTKCKIVDENLQWCDSGLELMLDQTDFLVIGTIGLQGCGKSTILSLLAGNSHQDAYRNYVFFPQTKETKEECLFQTTGIDMFVSPERIIFLDTQPMLSAAVMDCMLRYERKIPADYSSLSNYVEMQSMQVLTFLLSVCNILLIADDWFVDVNLLRFIQDAEMLKPPQHSSSSSPENPSSKDETSQFFPNVVFVHNKATREDFNPQTYLSMQRVLHNMFSSSKLRYRGGITMSNSDAGLGEGIINLPPGLEKEDACDVNLLMLPAFEFYKCDPEWLQTTIPDYRGYPSFSTIFSFFRSQILACPRSPLTNATLTEKNWYHFAARMWDSVRKSSLLAEYNRLLSN